MTTACSHSLEQTDNARFKRTAMKSVFQELYHREAILTVARDQLIVLRPNDTQCAVGVQDLGRYCCLVLMGTTSRPAIIMAKISTSDGEEHYMSIVRLMVGFFVQEQELFQLPRVWGIFGHGHSCDPQIDLLTQRTSRVFQHLSVQFEIAFQASPPLDARNTLAVVAVRHEPQPPEIYVRDRLLYPTVHTGCLVFVYDKLSLRQVNYEQGDDEETGNEEKISETTRMQSELEGNEERYRVSFREPIFEVGLSTM